MISSVGRVSPAFFFSFHTWYSRRRWADVGAASFTLIGSWLLLTVAWRPDSWNNRLSFVVGKATTILSSLRLLLVEHKKHPRVKEAECPIGLWVNLERGRDFVLFSLLCISCLSPLPSSSAGGGEAARTRRHRRRDFLWSGIRQQRGPVRDHGRRRRSPARLREAGGEGEQVRHEIPMSYYHRMFIVSIKINMSNKLADSYIAVREMELTDRWQTA